MRRSLWGVFVFGLSTSGVLAKDVNVGPVTISLPLPPGYCELDEGQLADARAINNQRLKSPGARVLGMSAGCSELAPWRSGGRLLEHFALYGVLKADEAKPLPMAPSAFVHQLCGEGRKASGQIGPETLDQTQLRLDRSARELKVGGRVMAVLAEDPLVCYLAMVLKLRTELGSDKTQLMMWANTVVKGKPLDYYLYAPYVDGATITSTLAAHRSNVAKLRAANPD